MVQSPTAYDAIIIGAGQAGGPLAHNLADRGWKVALIERQHLGGSCINYGCTPTKKMIASARTAETARRAGQYGVHTGPVQVDLAAVVAMKDELVASFRAGQEERVRSRPNITLYRGEGSFVGPHQVRVHGRDFEEDLTAGHIFINTGSGPKVPDIPGLQSVPYLTNHTILDLTELPRHLLILGGSYIGLEFGQMFRRFGSQVTIIEKHRQLMRKEDPDVSEALRQVLEAEGIRVLLDTGVESVRSDDGAVRIAIRSHHSKQTDGSQRQELEGSHLLVAAGRQPNTHSLNLEAAGVHTGKGGWITVNEYLETSTPGIYALGDVKGGPAFTHISYNDFQIVYHNLFHDEKKSTRERIIPYALYTDPELGRVGLTEKQALQQGYRIRVGRVPMSHVARAIENNRTQGLMKVVVDADSECLLGAAVLSENGGELVHSLMTLMMARAPWTLYHGAVFIHPTLSEGFFSLMDQVARAEVISGSPQADTG